MHEKLLIINGDDLGLSLEINEGISDAFNKGCLNSTSLLINMPGTDSALEMIQEYGYKNCCGIHLNISSGYCVSPTPNIELIADSNGKFIFDESNLPQSLMNLKNIIKGNKRAISQIIYECKKQVEKYISKNISFNHINFHHYINLLHPKIFEAGIRLAEELKVNHRSLCYPMINILGIMNDELKYYKINHTEYKTFSPDYSISNLVDDSWNNIEYPAYLDKLKLLLSELSNDEKIDSVELIVHPISDNGDSKGDLFDPVRKIENLIIRSKDFSDFINTMGYKIGNYSQLNGSARK